MQQATHVDRIQKFSSTETKFQPFFDYVGIKFLLLHLSHEL